MPSQGGEKWRERYYELSAGAKEPPQIMPDQLGPLPKGGKDPFERCNLWLLCTALASGVDKVRFVCLWNGGGGDGPGRNRAHLHRGRAEDGARHLDRHADVLKVRDEACLAFAAPRHPRRPGRRRDRRTRGSAAAHDAAMINASQFGERWLGPAGWRSCSTAPRKCWRCGRTGRSRHRRRGLHPEEPRTALEVRPSTTASTARTRSRAA